MRYQKLSRFDMRVVTSSFRRGKEEEGSKLKDELIKFFTDNPNPEDEKLHDWAESKGYEPSEVEDEVYKFATLYVKLLTQGRAEEKDVSKKDVDKKELEMGKKVEKEHIDDDDTVEEIALDHLAEMPDYYSKLKEMEKKSGRRYRVVGQDQQQPQGQEQTTQWQGYGFSESNPTLESALTNLSAAVDAEIDSDPSMELQSVNPDLYAAIENLWRLMGP